MMEEPIKVDLTLVPSGDLVAELVSRFDYGVISIYKPSKAGNEQVGQHVCFGNVFAIAGLAVYLDTEARKRMVADTGEISPDEI